MDIYVSLDTFKKQGQNIIDSKRDAWLSFFTYEKPEEITKLVHSYPEFIPLYKDIAEFRKKPEEVIGMFSEALKIMDRNTTKYMIDDLTKQRDDAVAALKKTQQEVADLKAQLAKQSNNTSAT